MRKLAAMLIAVSSLCYSAGCVVVLGVREFPDDAKIVVIDDEVYIVDTKSGRQRKIESGDATEIRIEKSTSENDD